jgi:hypothetical protein
LGINCASGAPGTLLVPRTYFRLCGHRLIIIISNCITCGLQSTLLYCIHDPTVRHAKLQLPNKNGCKNVSTSLNFTSRCWFIWKTKRFWGTKYCRRHHINNHRVSHWFVLTCFLYQNKRTLPTRQERFN